LTPGDDEVARILAVLRNLGEPAEVVADRLPESIMRSGARRNLPMHILISILIALFGVPLGIGGAGVLVGVLAALASLFVAYLAITGSLFACSGIFLLVGLARAYMPGVWDRLVADGYIRFDGIAGVLMEHQSRSGQALYLFLFAFVFGAAGWWLLRAGKHLLRGMRFLRDLVFDGMRRGAQKMRRVMRRERTEPVRPAHAAPRAV
jgi:hypothetical protein